MTSIEIVQRAYDLLADENHWWKGFAAASVNGICVPTSDPKAERFCLMGALHKARGIEPLDGPFVYHDALFAVLQFVPRDPELNLVSMSAFSAFNDRLETTHGMILDVLQKAKASLERKKACI